MAARKLQTEIDRTLKKVSEGVDLFESIHEKLMASTNATQKDKLETDLKTQIKKLQRLRDQIKTWLTSNDVKDKTQLMDNRKLIESQMERFKALEKEMKTKAFSKEGLIAATRLDPQEKAKLEARQTIEEFVDSLSRQIEQAEAEIEILQASSTGGRGKKSGKSSSAGNSEGRIAELERLNERRSWHISKLEAVMRLLENGKLSVEQVTELKEDVSYFVESNQEEDFEEDEGIYEDLHLDEEEDGLGLMQDHEDGQSESDMQSVSEDIRTPARPSVTTRTSTSAGDEISNPPSPVAARKTPSRKATSEAKTPVRQVSNPSVQPVSPASRQTIPPPLPPIKYAAAAAAAVAQNSTSTAAPAQPTPMVGAPATSSAEAASADSRASMSSPQSNQTRTVDTQVTAESYAETDTNLNATIHSAREASETESHIALRAKASPPHEVPTGSIKPSEGLNAGSGSYFASNTESASPSLSVGYKATGKPVQLQPTAPPSHQHAPHALSDLMSHFESVKQRSTDRLTDVNSLHAALENGISSAPEPRDSERPRYYHPRTPYVTPQYYPQQPHPALDNKEIYSRMDLDTLFFIFYYRTNTYEQWCAARELKRQSWRYHKQYLTWFQRLSQPQAITDEYEQGMYVYFDWENGWATRKKSDFRFEYYYLSED